MNRINANQKIPTHWAFITILVLSFLLSWFTFLEGKRIAREAKNYSAFNLEKRSGGEIFEN